MAVLGLNHAHWGRWSRSWLRILASAVASACLALFAAPGAFAASSNNDFVNAIAVSVDGGNSTVSTVGNTKETGEPPPSAGTGGCPAWWVWTSSSSPTQAPIIVTSGASNFDTVLDVWTGSAVGSLTRVAYNDDYFYSATGYVSTGYGSMLVFTPAPNTTYHFRVDSWAAALGGTAGLTLESVPIATFTMTTSAFEGSRAGVWSLNLSHDLVDQVPVPWSVTGGTASSSHYTLTGTSPQTLGKGVDSYNVTVTVSDDGLATGPLTVIATPGAATYSNYTPLSGTMVIGDAEAPLIYVNQNATGANNGSSWANAFTSLQNALSLTVPGNTGVWVAQGTYSTVSQTDTFPLVGGVPMYGSFAGTETALSQRDRFLHPTILSGAYGGGNSMHVVTAADGSTIDGFTISGGDATSTAFGPDGFGGGLVAWNVGCTVLRCNFIGNAAALGGGGCMLYSSSGTISGQASQCCFVGNSVTDSATSYGGGGLMLVTETSAPTTLANCVFTGNAVATTAGSANGGGALMMLGSTNAVVMNCTFYNNAVSGAVGGVGGAVQNYASAGASYVNSVFSANSAGGAASNLGVTNSGTQTASYCCFDTALESPTANGGNNLTLTNPQFVSTTNLAGADGIYGSADDGLALQNGSPCVNAGTGTGAPTLDISNHGRPLGPGYDIGAYEQPATMYIVPGGAGTKSGWDWADAKDLQNGLQTALNGDTLWVKGGTYAPAASASPTSTFQMVFGVNVYGGFAGTETTLSQRNMLLNKSILSGAVSQSYNLVTGASAARLDGFIITGGNANGSSPDFWGGGGLMCNGTSPTIVGCVFTGNAASYGGGAAYMHNPCAPIFKDCVFTSNTCNSNGGAIECELGANPSFTNCTFSGNSNSASRGGAIETYANGNFVLLNTVMWGDSQPEIFNNGSSPSSAYSDVEGGLPSGVTDAGSNINVDPQFVAPASAIGTDGLWMTADDGLMLGGQSPCLATGTNVGATVPTQDIVHNANPLGVGYDMGAYDTPYLSISATIPTGVKAVWSSGVTNAQFTITRDGLLSLPLTVTLSIGGTATAGSDYTAIPATVTIPAGASSVVVPVNVIASSQAENPVTVVATLVPGGPGSANAYATFASPLNSATVTITDQNTAGVILTPTGPFAGGSANELFTNQGGTTATFTVVLNSQPTAPVTIPLASSNTAEGTLSTSSVSFTTSNWHTPQTVTVNGVNDYIAHGPQLYQVLSGGAISSDPFYSRNITLLPAAQTSAFNTGMPYVAQSGNNWLVKINGAFRSPASFTVTNTGSIATINLSAPLPGAGDSVQIQYLGEQTFTGNGAATAFDTGFPFVLDSPATDWAVSVSGGVVSTSAYTIANDGSGNGKVTFTSAPANGAPVLVQTDIINCVNNNTYAKGVQVTPASGGVSVTEGGATANYTVVLTSQPSSGNVTINLVGVNQDPNATFANVTPSVTSLTFTPTRNQSVSGTTSGWNVPQTVTVSAARDFNIESVSPYNAQITQTVSAGAGCDYNGFAAPNMPVHVTDADVAGIVVTPASGVHTSEAQPLPAGDNSTTPFTVALTSRPTDTVTLTLISDVGGGNDGGVFYTSGPLATGATITLTFTPTDNQAVTGSAGAYTSGWNVPQTVLLQGLRGTVGVSGNTTYMVELNSAPSVGGAGSPDPNYPHLAAGTILETVTNIDIDIPAVLISTGSLTVTRGQPGQTFTVKLSTDPTTGANGHPTDIVAVSFADTAGLVSASPSTLVFTSSNFGTAQTVTVSAPDDGTVEPQSQADTLNYAVTSGNTAYAAISGSIPTTVLDDGVAGIYLNPTAGLITTEAGGTADIQVGLLSKPLGGAAVAVTLTSSDESSGVLGQRFYSSGISGSTITLAGSPNLSAVAANMLVAISGLGPNSGALTQVTAVGANTITVSPALADSTSVETLLVMASTQAANGTSSAGSPVLAFSSPPDLSQVFEGQQVLITGTGSGDFASTVKYVDRASHLVTMASNIPAGSGETAWFTTGPLALNWTAAQYQAAQTVTVVGVHNFQVQGNTNYAVTASAASTDPAYSTSQVVTLASSGTALPTGIPFVTYDGSNWEVLSGSATQAFTLTDNAGYAQANLLSPTTGSFTVVYLPSASLTNLDIDSPGFTVSPLSATSIFPAPGSPSTATYSIALTSEPTADVVVAVQSSNDLKGTVSPATLTFTQATPNGGLGWDQPHVVTITAVGSQVADGSVSFAVNPQPAVSSDPLYNALAADGVTLATVDPNSAGISVTPSATPIVTKPQSSLSGSFTVVLTSQPTSAVTIPISSSLPSKGGPSVSSLTFTPANWSTPQSVQVVGIANDIVQGNVPYEIDFGQPQTSDPGYAVLSPAPVQVVGEDTNQAGYILSDPLSQTGHVFNWTTPPVDPNLVTTDLGGTAEFQVQLTSEPTPGNSVSITLGSDNAALGTPSPTVLVFTSANWNQAQVVTITGGNNNASDTDGVYHIVSTAVVAQDAAYNGLMMTNVPVTDVAQNKTPTLAPIANVNVLENQATLPVVALTGITTGEASEVNALLVTATSDNQSLISNASLVVSYNSTTPVPSTGSLAFALQPNQFGTANITVTVTSPDRSGPPPFRGGDKSTSQTFQVIVGFVNQAPSFTMGGSVACLEGSPAQSIPGWATSISVGPPNQSSEVATFSCQVDNPSLFSVQPAINATTGNLTYTPAPTAFGTAHVTVTLTTNGGTANGGVDSYTPPNSGPNPNPFQIVITPVNHAPTFTEGGNISVTEGAGAQTFTTWATGITAGPPDESSQTLTFTCTNDNNGLFSVQPSLDLQGNLTFTTLPTTRGFTTVTVKLQDNGGTANGGVDTTIQTFTITVNPTNQAPVVSMSAPAGRQVAIGTMRVIQPTDLWATDVDSVNPAPIHDPTLVFTVSLPPGNGTLSDNGVALGAGGTFTQADVQNGLVAYTHDGGTSSSDGFAFTCQDAAIPAGSILASPPLPVATLPPGVSALTVFSILIDRSNPVVALTPAGPLPFMDQGPAEIIAATSTVSDPLQPSFAGGQIDISFSAGANANDVIAVNTTGSITLSGSTVNYNGSAFGTIATTQGVAGTVITVSSLTAVANTASVAAFLQSLTFQNTAISPSNPTTNPVTTRTMQVVVTDANNDTSQPATIDIAVTSIHHPPRITSGALYVTAENVPVAGQITAIDVDGNAMTYGVTGTPALGTVTMDPVTGSFSYIPFTGVAGTGTFHVHVTDAAGGFADQDVTVIIASDSPLEPFVTSNAPQTVLLGDTLVYNVVAWSPGTPTPSFSVVGLPASDYTLSTSGTTATLTLLPAATAAVGYVTFGIVVVDTVNNLAGVQPVTLLVSTSAAAGG